MKLEFSEQIFEKY